MSFGRRGKRDEVGGSLLGRISWQPLMAVSLIPLAWNYRIVGVIAAQVHHFHKKS